MKELLRELVLLMLCFFIGLAIQIYSPIEEFFDSIIAWLYKILLPATKGFMFLIPNWAIVLVFVIILLFIGIVVTRLFRIVAHSKNVSTLGTIISVFVTIVIGIPVTFYLMSILSKFISTADGISYSMIYCIFFALIMRVMSHIFGFSYRRMLNEPVRNCKVMLCEVTALDSYEVREVKAKKLTFEQAFSYIRNNTQEIPKRHFYQIVETGFFGLKKVDSWNYYRNGNVMEGTEEQFLSKLYMVNVDDEDNVEKDVIRLKLKDNED